MPVRFYIPALLVMLLTGVLFSHTAAAQQYIGGSLWENTTYSPAFNPYIVTEPVIVPEGIQLTIEPGTELRFMIGSSLVINKGTLVADGNADQPIRFTSLNSQGEENRWNGVQFNDAHSMWDEQGNFISGNILRHVILNRATTGLLVTDSSAIFIEDVQLINNSYGLFIQSEASVHMQQSTIFECSYGLYLRNSSNNLVQQCNISQCDIGIFFPSNSNSRHNKILNNNISYNRNIALFLSLGQSSLQYNIIRGNTVNHNNIGLHVGNGGTQDKGYNTLENNIVRFNDIGIKLSQDADTLRGNEINYNVVGLLMSRASNNEVSGNNIGNSQTWGIKITDGSNDNLLLRNNLSGNYAGLCVLKTGERLSELNKIQYNCIEGNEAEAILLQSGPQREITYNTIQSSRDTAVFVNRQPKDVLAFYNFWFTHDTLRVDSLIYDYYDEDTLGKVHYKPLSTYPYPDAPISAPRNVIKRQAGDSLLVSWAANPESDLAGYKIYYGNGPRSGFLHHTDVGMNTFFVLHGVLLSDTIAITAYDTDATGKSDQYLGHESAFALAIAGPYAGGNSEICEDQYYYTLEANAPDDAQISWFSDGDGTFAAPDQLITWYVPGPVDIESGKVLLHISQLNESGRLSDTLLLKIVGQPILFAGNDTTLSIAEIFSTLHAQAENFTTLLWTTSGDGYFDDGALLHTYYHPGEGDIANGKATLTLSLSSQCNDMVQSFTLLFIPSYDLSGRIHIGNMPAANVPVLALNSNPESSRAVTMSASNASGEFLFTGLLEGEYYIYAVPDPVMKETLPTYYAEKNFWHQAYLVPCHADIYDIDIFLNSLNQSLPLGEASIEGEFLYSGNQKICDTIYNSPWFPARSHGFRNVTYGSAAANHTILLMNPGLTHVLAWTLSGADGSFSFSGLPFGSYRLLGEKAGYTHSVSPLITLSPAHPHAENISLSIQEKSIAIQVPEPGEQVNEITIYPNPANEWLWINPAAEESDTPPDLFIYSASGKLMHTQSLSSNPVEGQAKINLSKLNPGLYYGMLRYPSGTTYTFKFILNRNS
ncbi:MAG: NosD domain-containing protein [Lentimicrobiaceae bacterium]|nr:NosD domain-containing protein [Lentimicrobiaceae bacterium]